MNAFVCRVAGDGVGSRTGQRSTRTSETARGTPAGVAGPPDVAWWCVFNRHSRDRTGASSFPGENSPGGNIRTAVSGPFRSDAQTLLYSADANHALHNGQERRSTP